MLRMMREPGTGRPAKGVRVIVLLVVVAMIGVSAQILMPALGWFVSLL